MKRKKLVSNKLMRVKLPPLKDFEPLFSWRAYIIGRPVDPGKMKR